VGGASVEPALAEICQSNGENTVWTCKLRKNVVFHDGSLLDADDVVMSISVLWDASNPLHKGNMGTFAYFKEFWGDFMNASYP
jgi:ABC-type transport system substrate-binding protein